MLIDLRVWRPYGPGGMDGQPPPMPATVNAWRWWVHLLVLTMYPLSLGLIGYLAVRQTAEPMLPASTQALLATSGLELVVFGVVFSVALAASRANARQLLLDWRAGLRPLWRGFLYSLALRALLIIATLVLALIAAAAGHPEGFHQFRPEVERIVDAEVLVRDPVYLALSMTLISFVVAGLREELWRAGMFAGLTAIFPRFFDTRLARFGSATLVAVVFGLGHLTQGVGGVLMSTVLGLGLGLIMLHYRSVWEAILAHGFFNATTFAMLYLIARFRPELLPRISGL